MAVTHQEIHTCGNCLAISSSNLLNVFRPCSGCSKVFFCSTFCEEYGRQRGLHAKSCVVESRKFCYFKQTKYSEVEHPAKCIICLEHVNARAILETTTSDAKQKHAIAGINDAATAQIISISSCAYKHGVSSICMDCFDKIAVTGQPSHKKCPFCRLALVQKT